MVLLPATSILRITVAAATILQDPTNNCGHRDACCSDTDIFSKYTAAESSRYKNTTNWYGIYSVNSSYQSMLSFNILK